MPFWPILVLTAILWGLALSLVLTSIMAISLVIARDMWVGDYPPDIRNKYGPMSHRARRSRPYIAVPFFLATLAIPLIGLYSLSTRIPDLPFIAALIFAFLTLLTFNVLDLLLLDWLIFCTIQPRWVILPGTEGMPGYGNYRFHLIAFLKGLAFCLLGGSIVALLWVGLDALLLQDLAA